MHYSNSESWFETISPNDQMIHGGNSQYFHTGEAALKLCIKALDGNTPRRILDFPSGHGRVLRWFKREWPAAELHAVEVDNDALKFVAETFGATPTLSTPNLDMPLPSDVDLIFSGSLLTHFDQHQIDAFLTRCMDSLAPGGALIFTAHGRIAALLAAHSDPIYGDLVDTKALYSDYLKTGFSYRNYDPNYPTYGLTLSSPTWMVERIARMPLARLAMLTEGGWGHQDVYVLRKHEWPLLDLRG